MLDFEVMGAGLAVAFPLDHESRYDLQIGPHEDYVPVPASWPPNDIRQVDVHVTDMTILQTRLRKEACKQTEHHRFALCLSLPSLAQPANFRGTRIVKTQAATEWDFI